MNEWWDESIPQQQQQQQQRWQNRIDCRRVDLAAAVCRAVANIFPGFANGFLNGWPTQSTHWISDTCVACGCTLSRPFSLCFCWPTEIESEEKRRASHIVCFLTRHFDSPLSGRPPPSLYSQIKMGAGAHYKARHPRVIFSSFYFYLYFFFFFSLTYYRSEWPFRPYIPGPDRRIQLKTDGAAVCPFSWRSHNAPTISTPPPFSTFCSVPLYRPTPPPPHSTLPLLLILLP